MYIRKEVSFQHLVVCSLGHLYLDYIGLWRRGNTCGSGRDHSSGRASIRCFQRPGRHRGGRGNGGFPRISGSVRHSDHNADGVRY